MVLTAKCTMALFFTLLCAKFSIMRVGQIPSTNLSSNILNDETFSLTIMLSLLVIAKFINTVISSLEAAIKYKPIFNTSLIFHPKVPFFWLLFLCHLLLQAHLKIEISNRSMASSNDKITVKLYFCRI